MMRRGQSQAANAYAERALKIAPNAPDAWLLQGNAYLAARNLGKAQAAFQRYAQLVPKSPVGAQRLALVALTAGRLEEAEKQFQSALQADPKQYDALEGLTTVYVRQNKIDKAEQAVKHALANDQCAVLYNLLGRVYTQGSRFSEAEAALLQARKIDPTNAMTLQLLGNFYFQQKSVDKAITQYEEATRVTPNDAGTWTIYGMLNEGAGRLDVARAAYEKALQLSPDAGPAANNLAWIYAEEGKDMDRALDLARRAKLAMPDSPSVSDTLAWIYYKRKLFDSALPLVQEALKNNPENANYRYHLAAILNGQGRKDQAKAEIGKALKMNAALREQPDVRQLLNELSL
jgi:tetratricopeptide (TPR) repeat protein